MREWIKPKLVILARSKFAEATLTTCKAEPTPTGVTAADGSCYYEVALCLDCAAQNVS